MQHEQVMLGNLVTLARFARAARCSNTEGVARLTGVACTVGVSGVVRVAGAGGVVAARSALRVGPAALEAAGVLWYSGRPILGLAFFPRKSNIGFGT